MSMVWTPKQDFVDQETEALSVSVNRSLHAMGLLQVAVDHWKLVAMIFLGLFTGHILVDLALVLLWWSAK